ncbi:NADPH:quinone oxidoreductase family protein [Nocardia beijingensis]|uniref:NADPH:quinone oxidoreductase family protein n=1 Tax=Nocardia beijingensis TaxID=95162 RepID=UPI001893777F|nr:NADPH:quinone oxidoreductase family protein [Nocardia beijingensis]MBF6469991.1 NADPH:quinone oxidoreductase family protein [Nocardia beijingensis]
MHAWTVSEYGEPDSVLCSKNIEVPRPGPGQLVVRTRAAPANFPDAMLCRGEYQLKPPLPFTPGIEICGEVVELGREVKNFAIGDRVIGLTDLPHGAFAEYALTTENRTFLAPEVLDDAEAAALTLAYQTGWFGLHQRARLTEGETLLVHAAAGGVGSAAVQLGKAAGATVIAVVGGPAKVQAARNLGADIVVDRSNNDFVEVVKAETNGRGADVIYDPVGGETYMRSTKCVAFEGRLVLVGFASGTIPHPPLNHPLIKNYSILGLHWGLYNDHSPAAVHSVHEHLSRLADRQLIKPMISERLAFADIPAGVSKVASGAVIGRVAFVTQQRGK